LIAAAHDILSATNINNTNHTTYITLDYDAPQSDHPDYIGPPRHPHPPRADPKHTKHRPHRPPAHTMLVCLARDQTPRRANIRPARPRTEPPEEYTSRLALALFKTDRESIQ
jgi:hypothetical protein